MNADLRKQKNRTKRCMGILRRSGILYHAAAEGLAEAPDAAAFPADLPILSPVLHSYVIWILRKAMDDGIKRLYFLARDGYLPCRVAQAYCCRLQLPIDCRYLYCSRAALRIPMYHLDMEEALDYICRGGLDVTLHRIMLRAGLEENQAQTVFSMLELPYAFDEPIPYRGLAAVRVRLAQCPSFLELMRRNSEEAFPGLHGYFRQEGLLDEVPCAIVDSGWTGTMQKSIRDICRVCGSKTLPTGYYFGLYHLPEGSDASIYSAFFFTPGRGLLRKIFFNNNLFEVVFSAPHGSTLHYRHEDGRYAAVFAEPDGQIVNYICQLEHALDQYTRRVTEQMTIDVFRSIPVSQLRRLTASLLRLFMWIPTAVEAKAYGELPFSDDLQDLGRQELGRQMTKQQLRDGLVLFRLLQLFGICRKASSGSAWYEASAVRSLGFSLFHRADHLLYQLLVHSKPR